MDEPYVTCVGFKFYSNFDSANLARVEHVEQENAGSNTAKGNMPSVFEFNVWTKPDCAGTQYENGNRTWFYFGVKAAVPSTHIRLNIVDINKQAKMYSQGMAPVYKVVPGKPTWERVRDKLTYSTSDENVFSVSFKYKTPENGDAIVYFAFTYPYSYTDLQHSLRLIDEKQNLLTPPLSKDKDDIYYVRECVCKSVECRRIDLLTISSYHNMTTDREDRLESLFPDRNVPRPFKFTNKKVIFVSARVHPGETPSTFVLNGLLNLLLCREDPVAVVLRRHYVFKLIPFLNPDGVSRGHYRTDTNGTNLNRVYLQPNLQLHPSVYAARALLRYHHHDGRHLPDPIYHKQQQQQQQQLIHPSDMIMNASSSSSEIVVERDVSTLIESTIVTNDRRLSNMSLTEVTDRDTTDDGVVISGGGGCPSQSELLASVTTKEEHQLTLCNRLHNDDRCDGGNNVQHIDDDMAATLGGGGAERGEGDTNDTNDSYGESGLFLYVDMHGHASKKGIFMYGNHFNNMADSVECMLLPKIMSLNNHNFHFTACNFTERNMYLKDRRDGMSREGSGRVAVLKLTGLVRSYTLECNYNTGRLINQLPATVREGGAGGGGGATGLSYNPPISIVPPKYNPHLFEEVGRALAASILDLTGQNPLSRLANSEFHSLNGLRQWLMTNCISSQPPSPPPPPTTTAAAITTTIPILQHIHELHNQHILRHNATDHCVTSTTATATATTTTTTKPCQQQQQEQRVSGQSSIAASGGAPTSSQSYNWRRASTVQSSGGGGGGGVPKATTSRYLQHQHHRTHHHHTYLRYHNSSRHNRTAAPSSRTSHVVGSGSGSGVVTVKQNNRSNAATMRCRRGGSNSGAVAGTMMTISATTATATATATPRRVTKAPAAQMTVKQKSTSKVAAAAAAGGTVVSTSRSTNNNTNNTNKTSNSRRLKLREICWIRAAPDNGQGKALIAKYSAAPSPSPSPSPGTCTPAPSPTPAPASTSSTVHNHSIEENLIVSWDANNANPQVFAQRTSIIGHHEASYEQVQNTVAATHPHHNPPPNSRSIRSSTAAATTTTTTNKRPTFRVHNFRRRQHIYNFHHPHPHHHQHPVIAMTSRAAATATTVPLTAAAGATTIARQYNRKIIRQQQQQQYHAISPSSSNQSVTKATLVHKKRPKGGSKVMNKVNSPITTTATNISTNVGAAGRSIATSQVQSPSPNATQRQLQHKLQCRRKRKRNKSGLVAVHH